MKFRLPVLIFLACLTGILLGQVDRTLPNNAWRVSITNTNSSGTWRGSHDYSGVGPQEFILDDYGRRYFDHIEPEAWYDFYDLDSLQITSQSTLSEYIREFNQSQSAGFWNDTLPDFTTEFFGTDSVVIGGVVFNDLLKHVITRQDFRMDYGISNTVTFSLLVPYYSLVEEERQYSWSADEVAGLDDFIAYHTAAQTQFDDFADFFSYFPINADTLATLLAIRDRVYSNGGRNSVLWALEGGSDPAGNAIAGQAYNPFANDDTTTTTIDSLLNWYLPAFRTTSGLGDVSMKLSFLIAGKPSWSQLGYFSVYAGFGIQFPTGKQLSKFKLARLGTDSRPQQFSDYPLGSGSTRISAGLFGEFYREIAYWDVAVNWSTEIGISSREFHYFPVNMLGTNMTNPDSITVAFPEQYGYRPGWDWSGRIAGRLELWPDRVAISGSVSAYFKARDRFYSVDEDWARYMQSRSYNGVTVYDTRIMRVTPALALQLVNLHPLKKIGPVPFELELGGSKPLLTRHAYSDFSLWIGFTTYFQAW